MFWERGPGWLFPESLSVRVLAAYQRAAAVSPAERRARVGGGVGEVEGLARQSGCKFSSRSPTIPSGQLLRSGSGVYGGRTRSRSQPDGTGGRRVHARCSWTYGAGRV